jgi:benzoyl-CoA reductase subunit C
MHSIQDKLTELFTIYRTDTQRQRVGFLCPYTVEEIIDAAGFVPFRIIPEQSSLDRADAYLPSNICSFLRQVVEMGVTEELKELNCIIINHSCDAARRVFDLLDRHTIGTKIFFQDIPRGDDSASRAYFRHVLVGLRSFLEDVARTQITDEKLLSSIKRYNENRRLMRELYALRAAHPGLVDSALMQRVIENNGRNPKSIYNSILASLIGELKGLGGKLEKPKTGKRIFVSGALIDPLPLIGFIENAGGLIVGDDFCFGGRYCAVDTDEGGDPLSALSKRYLEKTPCGRMEKATERFTYIINEVKRYNASALIYVGLKFCDNFLVDYPRLKIMLDREGIPSLFLESEYSPLGRGQLKTRIEGFLERLL